MKYVLILSSSIEFRLVNWYITTPFKVARVPANQLPFKYQISHRRELLKGHFAEFDGKETIDVRRFQRKVRKEINRASMKLRNLTAR